MQAVARRGRWAVAAGHRKWKTHTEWRDPSSAEGCPMKRADHLSPSTPSIASTATPPSPFRSDAPDQFLEASNFTRFLWLETRTPHESDAHGAPKTKERLRGRPGPIARKKSLASAPTSPPTRQRHVMRVLRGVHTIGYGYRPTCPQANERERGEPRGLYDQRSIGRRSSVKHVRNYLPLWQLPSIHHPFSQKNTLLAPKDILQLRIADLHLRDLSPSRISAPGYRSGRDDARALPAPSRGTPDVA